MKKQLLSFESYKALTEAHKKIYNKKKNKMDPSYERYYWIDTERSWKTLDPFLKEGVIKALIRKIERNEK